MYVTKQLRVQVYKRVDSAVCIFTEKTLIFEEHKQVRHLVSIFQMAFFPLSSSERASLFLNACSMTLIFYTFPCSQPMTFFFFLISGFTAWGNPLFITFNVVVLENILLAGLYYSKIFDTNYDLFRNNNIWDWTFWSLQK